MSLEFEFLGLFGERKETFKDNFIFTKKDNKYLLSFNSKEFYEIAKVITENNVELRNLTVLDGNNIDILSKYFNNKPVTFKNLKDIEYNYVISYTVEVIPHMFKKSFVKIN